MLAYVAVHRSMLRVRSCTSTISNRLHTPFAFPLIRFADVLLMLSEAYNEAGQLDKAVTEFNKVRARVGMPGLNSGPAWMVVSNKEQMAERIRKERAVEFAGEGLRFSDLRRWGYEIAHKTLNNVDAVNIYGERSIPICLPNVICFGLSLVWNGNGIRS